MWKRWRNYVVSIVVAVLAALSTYYTTINGIKINVATKAEEKFVANLDKRISMLEVRLAENFATKEDFYKLKEDLIIRLSRIEININRKESSVENR